MNAPTPVLDPGAVYSSDNGRLICLHCAGSSALYTGRDLSGQPVVKLTAADVAEWLTYDLGPAKCESGCTTLTTEA